MDHVVAADTSSEDLWPNPEILGVQSRLYSPGYVGPARWVLFEPRARRAFSALGKDVVPDAIAVLAAAAGGVPRAHILRRYENVTPRNLDSLVDSRLLTTRPTTASDPAGLNPRSPSVVATFHTANVDYPFFDYGSPSVIADESELLDHYAKLWPAPSAVIAAEVVSAAGAYAGENWLDEPEVALIRPVTVGTAGVEGSMLPPTASLASSVQGAVLTNPALALRFGPRLAADVLWPAPRNVPIDLTDFLVLNHCLPSTRGDRDTSLRGIVEAVPGATECGIQRLRHTGALLAVRDGQALYGGSRMWVRHDWYLALLAYLEARSHGRLAPVTSLVPQDGSYLGDLGAIRSRRTTRVFVDAALSANSAQALLRRVFLHGIHANVTVSLAIWQVSGLATGLYRWQSEQLELVGDAPERATVATNAAGQTAASTGALALWISSLTDPSQPARYVMDLVDLGRLGQRICLAAAELGIGVFLTPAVCDSGVCALLGLAHAERRLTYLFGLGVDPDLSRPPQRLAQRRTH